MKFFLHKLIYTYYTEKKSINQSINRSIHPSNHPSINDLTPSYLSDMFTRTSSLSDYGLRSSRMNFELPKNRTNYFKNSFVFTGAKVWNNLPNALKEEKFLDTFKSKLKLFSLSA